MLLASQNSLIEYLNCSPLWHGGRTTRPRLIKWESRVGHNGHCTLRHRWTGSASSMTPARPRVPAIAVP